MTRVSRCLGVVGAIALAACARTPSPLTPAWHGSIGTPSDGVLAGGTELGADLPGLRWLRSNDRHWGLGRFTEAIARAAASVAHERPGPPLYAGDLSVRRGGGPLLPHFSHRSGIDADLLFYVTTLDGIPVDSPGFVHFGADGIARDDRRGRWLRFDVEREWLLVKALIEDPQARVQWIFVSDVVATMLVDWAVARGDSSESIGHAREVMLQPRPGGVHDDHIHVRTACSADEMVAGCESIGPRRAWLSYDPESAGDRDEDLALALLQPLETGTSEPSAGHAARATAMATSQGKSKP